MHSQRYYVGGLLCSETQVGQISENLLELARGLERPLGLPAEDIEFHGYEICHANKQWKPLAKDVQDRVDLYISATKAINSYGAPFFIKPVKLNMLAIRGEHEMALLYLLEEVDRRCEKLGLERGSIQVICDKIGIQKKIQESYLSARIYGTRGWKPRKLEWFTEKLSFLDSRDHRLIQAVDLLLFAHCRSNYLQHQLANGSILDRAKKKDFKAQRRICESFGSITEQLPTFEPTPFRNFF